MRLLKVFLWDFYNELAIFLFLPITYPLMVMMTEDSHLAAMHES